MISHFKLSSVSVLVFIWLAKSFAKKSQQYNNELVGKICRGAPHLNFCKTWTPPTTQNPPPTTPYMTKSRSHVERSRDLRWRSRHSFCKQYERICPGLYRKGQETQRRFKGSCDDYRTFCDPGTKPVQHRDLIPGRQFVERSWDKKSSKPVRNTTMDPRRHRLCEKNHMIYSRVCGRKHRSERIVRLCRKFERLCPTSVQTSIYNDFKLVCEIEDIPEKDCIAPWIVCFPAQLIV